MTTQSPPLTPPDCDLRNFPFMSLDVVRLRDSDISILATGDEFRCAVLLWCASWHQVPAASLPDNDVILSRLAGFGRVVDEWLKVKDGALRGWIKCADGRLYHPVVAEKANEAWESRLEYRQRKEVDRLRKAAGRVKKKASVESQADDGNDADKQKLSNGQPATIQRTDDECPADKLNFSGGQVAKIQRIEGENPTENALIGIEIGREINKDIDKAANNPRSDSGPSPPLTPLSRSAEIAILLRKGGAAVTAEHSPIIAWAEQEVSDEQVLQALDIAKHRRADAGSQQPINAGFLDSILNGEVLVKKSPKPSRHHGIHETDFREGVSDDGRF